MHRLLAPSLLGPKSQGMQGIFGLQQQVRSDPCFTGQSSGCVENWDLKISIWLSRSIVDRAGSNYQIVYTVQVVRLTILESTSSAAEDHK